MVFDACLIPNIYPIADDIVSDSWYLMRNGNTNLASWYLERVDDTTPVNWYLERVDTSLVI